MNQRIENLIQQEAGQRTFEAPRLQNPGTQTQIGNHEEMVAGSRWLRLHWYPGLTPERVALAKLEFLIYSGAVPNHRSLSRSWPDHKDARRLELVCRDLSSPRRSPRTCDWEIRRLGPWEHRSQLSNKASVPGHSKSIATRSQLRRNAEDVEALVEKAWRVRLIQVDDGSFRLLTSRKAFALVELTTLYYDESNLPSLSLRRIANNVDNQWDEANRRTSFGVCEDSWPVVGHVW